MFVVTLRLMIDGFDHKDQVYRVKKEGKEPSVMVQPDDDFAAVAKKLFIDITGLNPNWAGLKRGNWVHNNEHLIIDYCACVCVTDKLNDGYQWELT